MISTSRNSSRSHTNTKIHHRQCTAHLTYTITASIRVTQPELPVTAVPPTLHTNRRQRTRVRVSSSNSSRSHTVTKIYRHRNCTSNSVSVTELPILVVTPTLHTNRRQRTRVISTSRNSSRSHTNTKIYRRQVVTHLTDTITTSIRVTQPEFPILVVTPTLHCTCIQNASVSIAGSDLHLTIACKCNWCFQSRYSRCSNDTHQGDSDQHCTPQPCTWWLKTVDHRSRQRFYSSSFDNGVCGVHEGSFNQVT